ncbi:vWA-MoxR associated conflict system protein [Streptomyces fuscichromogenes]|uniref:vWA-MoxR associated protein middle region 2 domain-containing protein n=1 Tax=Streptomyces fuscichromogenes TaxID=1324013 RepID=A0A917UHA7_9ACTN|nr:hypothetical protein [Streptomyces fuscichromogenes]GGM94167.1 hypothetical protein GCM10011578_013040 [Streptomyces fuscichromogenes]
MTGPAPRRHALVIAPQCAELEVLAGLDAVAQDLYRTLTDQWTGACGPSPVSGSALLHGTSVGQALIERVLREAALAAGAEQAVLVVALVGHGIVSGRNPTLFLMAGDSHRDVTGSAVNVGEILTRALETPGLPGVILLVDTCHAGGGVPDLKAFDGGVRRGAADFAMLSAVGAAQTAHGLAFSRGISRVLTEGIAGAGELLPPTKVLRAVRDAVPGQDARHVSYEGSRFGQPLWLARNASHRPDGSALGPRATAELRSALAPLGGTSVFPEPVSGADALRRLHTGLQAREHADPAALAWALRVVHSALDSVRTVEFLSAWPGEHPLTSERLRRALWLAAGRPAAPLPESTGTALLTDAVEYLRLHTPGDTGTRNARLAHFVAALAVDDGLTARHPALLAWAAAIGVRIELAEAFGAVAQRGTKARLRLVVSLHAAVADQWPETLEAWLLDRGEVFAHEDRFDCPPTQQGVERELERAVRWASAQARRIGVRPYSVDVAASAALLLRWRPELTSFGELLGRRYDVLLRWSERLCPPEHLWWINESAREKLEQITAWGAGRAPVDWLGEQDMARADELKARLERGEFDRAVALAHRPPRFEKLMETLLAYAPIVLWPGVEDCTREGFQASLDKFWHLLPAEFCEAYRCSWRRSVPGQPDGREQLALWRTIWHDPEWLDFCDWFGRYTVTGENAS